MAHKNEGEVIFRRVRGRIIPIRVKKGDRRKGIATAGAGFGVATGGGLLARGISMASRKSDIQGQRAFGLAQRLVGRVPRDAKASAENVKKFKNLEKKQRSLLRKAFKFRTEGALLKKKALGTRLVAAAIGGALISKGIEQATGREGGIIGDIGGGVAAAAAVVAAGDSTIRKTTQRAVKRAVKFALKARF